MFGSPARSTVWRRFVLVATLALLVQPMAAQPARNVGVVSDAERARIGFDPAESAGLFIGIRTFDDDQLAEVPYAVDDAIDLAHLFAVELALMPASKVVLALEGEAQKVTSRGRLDELRRAGATVTGAARSDFYRLLGQQARASGPRGLFVVSVASHGFSDAGRDSLVTRDAVADHITATGFQVSALVDLVGSSNAPRRVVLLDACREGLTGQRGQAEPSGLARSFVEAIDQVEGMVVLAAATQNGFAYDDMRRKNGVFTAAILDGLRGGASADDRGFITVEALARFAQDQVVSWVRQHRSRDRDRSLGITKTIEGPAAELPLAVDRTFVTRARQFEARKAAALEKLKAEIGPVISGRMYDDVASLLATADVATADPWLSRIEALSGQRQLQEGFAFYYGKHFQPVVPPPPRRRQAGDLWIEPTTGMRFRYIPAGTFLMGNPESDDGLYDKETEREVTLEQGYWMGETEVTQAQWQVLMGKNPSYFQACVEDCPVEQVNWFEAVAFANAMSEKASRTPCYRVSGGNGKAPGHGLVYETVEPVRDCDGFRLPTEAEWERAARAGTTTALYTGKLTIKGANHGPELDPIAWYGGNSGASYVGASGCTGLGWHEKQYPDSTTCGTKPVGAKLANRWKLLDMLGNVWEWCSDWHSAYSKDAVIDPVGPSDGSRRVIRGGSWNSHAWHVRAAYRHANEPSNRDYGLGFRLSSGPGLVEAEP